MNLPYDMTRCAGRLGIGPDDPICQKRAQCARYLIIDADRDAGIENYKGIPFITHCHDGDHTPLFMEVTDL